MKSNRILARKRELRSLEEREHAGQGDSTSEAWSFVTWSGATVVWLMFLGLALTIWPGWPRIGDWFR